MGAIRAKTLADLRRRRLQSSVIAVVLFLASGAATLALSILVESHAPFDHAFASANGAHLVVDYDGRISRDQLAATGSAPVVTASAGPWPIAGGAMAHPKGGLVLGATFSGRPTPDATIDAVTIEAGRWWQAPGEAVLDQDTTRLLNKQVGDSVDLYPAPAGEDKGAPGRAPEPGTTGPAHTLTVVGIAGSVSTPGVAAWMSPVDIAALSGSHVPMQEMLYRVSPSSTDTELAAATASITSGLPADAVVDSTTWLDLKAGVDRIADLFVPILLAFSGFALLAAAFTIANVVSGIVLTSYRDIGVMKAVGFTPSQITGILVAQILMPVTIGALVGALVGTIGSQPIVKQAALSFGLPTAFTLSLPVVAVVLLIAVATAALAAAGPAIRAGRLSAVAAMTRGTSPAGRPDGGRLRRLGLRLPLALPIRLGVAAGAAHPVRAAMTLGALVVGVSAVTFSIGLNASLLRVMDGLNRNVASPVRAELQDSAVTSAEVTAAFADNPATAHFVSIGDVQVSVPRVGAIPFFGYRNDASWLGYMLIEGRWFASAGEAVAPTNFFAQTGLHVGDTLTVVHDARSVTVRLVGEIFDQDRQARDNLLLRGTWADLAALQPGIEPNRWEAAPNPATEARTYEEGLQHTLRQAIPIFLVGDSLSDDTFLLFLTVVGVMGVVLVTMSLGGVFNTVLLETRQRTHEIAVLKAIGLTPAQIMAMIVAAIVPVGVLAGLVGVPIGVTAQRVVLTYMGHVATKTAIPPVVFDVFPPLVFVGLALAGLTIGVAGALPPAQRAARARIAPVLQAE